MAIARFEEVLRTAGFIGRLLEEEGLGVRSKEEVRVFGRLVRWMREGEGCGLRESELLGKIRFGLWRETTSIHRSLLCFQRNKSAG